MARLKHERDAVLDLVRQMPLEVPFSVRGFRGRRDGTRLRVALKSPVDLHRLRAVLCEQIGFPPESHQVRAISGGFLVRFSHPGVSRLAGAFFSAFMGAELGRDDDAIAKGLAKEVYPAGVGLAAMLSELPAMADAVARTFAAAATDYYALIDRADRGDRDALERVLSMFNEDAIYIRGDKVLRGREAIERFYLEERRVRFTHTVESVEVQGTDVFVKGRYEGLNGQGQPVSGSFQDTWRFENLGIAQRITVLGEGVTADRVE